MRDHLLIYLNGRVLRIGGDDAFLTLAEFLRRSRRLTGTKIVCAEGDCGACAVLVGRVSAEGNRIRYASVNSCIQLMFQLDATHVVTVEGLKYGDELNPIQKTMVSCHGTQCGFCTPGFVVSLCDFVQKTERVDAHDVRRALVGNLCRCTGYDSIVRAAMQADRSAMKSLDELYPPENMLAELTTAGSQEVCIQASCAKFLKPVSIESALRFRRENADCLIVSGATDLAVQRNKGTRRFDAVMSCAAVRELHGIEITPQGLCIGAGSTLSQLEGVSATHLPELSRSLAYFGSPLIRNAATLAGNLVNASPIGDAIPTFFALDGEVEIAGANSRQWIKIDKFYAGYRRTVLKSDEIVTRMRLPIPARGEAFKIYKVSKRKDLDISSFGAAIWMRLSGARVEQIRIAFGGVAPVVVRLPRAEAFLSGKIASRELFAEAGNIACGEVNPISDVRGTEAYRRVLAKNILVKFWQDIEGDDSGVRA
ncbi:MAG: FAD binding domain-containing protein [Tepidisphaeraceae bacterium]